MNWIAPAQQNLGIIAFGNLVVFIGALGNFFEREAVGGSCGLRGGECGGPK